MFMVRDIKDFKNFIFDFDGTIADTYKLHEKAFHQVLDEINVFFNYENYTGLTTDKVFTDISHLHDLRFDKNKIDSLVFKKRKIANDLFKTSIKFIPGAEAYLNLLVKLNKNLFVASSGSSLNVNEGLKTLKIEKYFKEIVTADVVKVSKPEPDIFNYIVNKYDLAVSETVVIEDAVSGIISSNRSGLRVICVNEEIDKSLLVNYQYGIQNYDQLYDLLNND